MATSTHEPAANLEPAAIGGAAEGLYPPNGTPIKLSVFKDLVLHLVKRELDSTHRMTVLGWAWPLTRQLVQLGVLVFIFGSVLNLEIEDFPVFVFAGLIAWAWFSSGISAATSSILGERHLLYYPRLPPAVIPIAAVFVPLVDVLMALPVLGILLVLEGSVHTSAAFLPLVLLVQLMLMAGLAWLTAAGSVFLRDIPNIVLVTLTVLFYLTPVFYGLAKVPERYAVLLKLNPMATIVTANRWLLLGEAAPSLHECLYTVGLSVVIAVAGYIFFVRVQDRFVDNL